MDNFSLHFVPLVPLFFLFGLFCLVTVLMLFGLLRRARGVLWRSLSLLFLLLVLANPSVLREQRAPIKDKVLVVTDHSSSQQIGGRTERTNKIVGSIKQQLAAFPETEPVFVSVQDEDDETHVWSALKQAVADIEMDALSGVILVTDGQIHDTPDKSFSEIFADIPVHTILTGSKDEKDIAVLVTEAPRYGLVGDDIKISVRVNVQGEQFLKNKTLRMTVMQDGKPAGSMHVTPGEEKTLRFRLEHAGDAVFSFYVEPIKGEMTPANNTAVAIVKTVRDRLKVLLISGQPHTGERTWRNLLKSDPAVDLVHFTILRFPGMVDRTPSYELSLISFPVHELFQRKIKKFDLIIFDRYRIMGVLQSYYLRNIRNYVREGGALLVAAGPEYAMGKQSLYNTVLKDILPARPFTGAKSNVVKGFIPKLTELGHVHPVTETFDNKKRKWGRWFRQVGAQTVSPDTRVVMSGADNLPLLMLDNVGKGRVAWLGSDQMWLWTRGFETGGPQRELLRRLAHWLMKEPDLEENKLSIDVAGKDITVRRRSLLDVDQDTELTMHTPSGESKQVVLSREMKRRWQKATINVGDFGLYRFDDLAADQTGFAVVGKVDVPELQKVVTTDQNIAPYTKDTGGGILWLGDEVKDFSLEQKGGFGARMFGDDWLGLKKNAAYRVTGLKNYPLLPPFWAMLLIVAAVMTAWLREGKS